MLNSLLNKLKLKTPPPPKLNHISASTFYDLSIEEYAYADPLLQDVVENVVQGLEFSSSMIAVIGKLDDGTKVLSVRAASFSHRLMNLPWGEGNGLLQYGEKLLGQKLIENYVELSKNENFGVRAINQNKEFDITDSLMDLFVGQLGEEKRPLVDKIQTVAGYKQFITVPFRNEDGELVGNLFAGDTQAITKSQRRSLMAFSRMASYAIQTVKLNEQNRKQVKKLKDLDRKNKTQLTQLQSQNKQLSLFQQTSNELLESTLRIDRVLQTIVDGVVGAFNFQAAFIAMVEKGHNDERILKASNYSLNPNIGSAIEIIDKYQKLFKKEFMGNFVYIDRNETLSANGNKNHAQQNLGVKIILEGGEFETTDSLYDVWKPKATRIECDTVQSALGINAIAIFPFRIINKTTNEMEPLGNICVASKRESFSDDEIAFLNTFKLQASLAINNAKLYFNAQRFASFQSLSSNLHHSLKNIFGKMGVFIFELEESVEEFDEGEVGVDEVNALLDENLAYLREDLEQAKFVLKHFSEQMKAGEGALNFEAFQVNSLIKKAIRKSRVDQTNIKVKQELDKQVPEVRCIKEHILQILVILINNAAEAIESSGEIVIRTSHVHNLIQISVTDDGCGISDELQKRLFRYGITTKKHTGSGYGLWWTKTVLEFIDGTITFQSEVDVGSTFVVNLPV